MSKIKNGGPAFPYETNFSRGKGMSLRDWYAGQAIPSAWEVAMTFRPPDDAQSPEQYCAVQAYAIADAMLAEREKQEAAE